MGGSRQPRTLKLRKTCSTIASKSWLVVVAVAAQLHIRSTHGCQLGCGEACHIVLHHVADLHQIWQP